MYQAKLFGNVCEECYRNEVYANRIVESFVMCEGANRFIIRIKGLS